MTASRSSSCRSAKHTPGGRLGQAQTLDAKVDQARHLHERLGGGFTVAVDDLDGSLHTALDPKPNAAYLVGSDRRLLFRAIWASDERGLHAALAGWLLRG